MNRRELLKMLGMSAAALPFLKATDAAEIDTPVETGEEVTVKVGGQGQTYILATAGENIENGDLVTIDKRHIARLANGRDLNACAIADVERSRKTFFLTKGQARVNIG